MAFLSSAYGFLRMASGLKAFVGEPISVDAARALVRRGMQTRDAAFLRKVEWAVFRNPRSPYLQLFRAAGCTLGDVALRPACPKVLLNTEIGDHAVLETRRCGCLLDEMGYCLHLHTIRSFEKLTGLGVTLVGGDLFHLLEEVLPKRFGGSIGDYQLVEAQDAQGLPRYTLRISPEVGVLDETAVVAGFLHELGQLRTQYRFMADLWARADIVHVTRCQPIPTPRGKILPFRTLGPA